MLMEEVSCGVTFVESLIDHNTARVVCHRPRSSYAAIIAAMHLKLNAGDADRSGDMQIFY